MIFIYSSFCKYLNSMALQQAMFVDLLNNKLESLRGLIVTPRADTSRKSKRSCLTSDFMLEDYLLSPQILS